MRQSSYRPDIQGLRAIAVALVLGFHVVPRLIPGGFVGVDVFFVISGFLITRMLVDEAQLSGRISVGRFLYRRARRLLPAAGVVLVSIMVATILLLPGYDLLREAKHVLASTFQFENWLLVRESSDYLLNGATGTATQHFWTLSLEWQIYLGWALLVALGVVVVGRLGRRTRRGEVRYAALDGAPDEAPDEVPAGAPAAMPSAIPFTVLALATTVILISLTISIILSTHNGGLAYYATQSRAWEFALGAAVTAVTALRTAKVVPAVRPAPQAVIGTIAAIIGIGLIVFASLRLSSDATYPGWHALIPSLGAALAIAGGGSSLTSLLSSRPFVWIGDRSYAIYLWHWPLLLFFTSVLPVGQTWVRALLVTAISIGLAALTKMIVENPPRRSSHTRLVAASMVLAVALPAGLAGAAIYWVTTRTSSLASTSPAGYPGAAAMDPTIAALYPVLELKPNPLVAERDFGDAGPDLACLLAKTTVVTCAYGDKSASRTLVLAGDSHAWQWLPAYDLYGKENGWRVVTLVKPSCPLGPTTVTFHGVVDVDCQIWKSNALNYLLANSPELVVVAGLSPYGYEFADYHVLPAAKQVAGYVDEFTRLRAAHIRVVVMQETPFIGFDVPACVASHPEKLSQCSVVRSKALDAVADPLALARKSVDGVGLINLNDWICSATTCNPVVGNVLVYRDTHHLTATYTRTLEPMLSAALARFLAG